MEPFLNFLKDVTSSQPLMQVFVGGCTMVLIGWMVTRARSDKENVPAAAPQTLADVPPPFLNGPISMIDILREQRDYLRRISEDMSKIKDSRDSIRKTYEEVSENVEDIKDCTRSLKDEAKRQTDLLDKIEREQSTENRSKH